jgi:Zn-dependent peptidase ImmA (M78 family)
LQSDPDWLETIPVKELTERGYLKPGQEKTELIREALAFYGVGSVGAWHALWDEPAIAARRSRCFESQPGPASAWIRQGELQARETECKPFDRGRLQQALQTIRGLTREEPEIFEPETKKLCAEAGVVLSLVREMKKASWNGATKWLSSQKAMILICLRGKSEDKFWFSFFHEAGHVLHDSTKDLLINDGSSDDPREERANRFAAEFLIPSSYDKEIHTCRSRDDIVGLADRLGISPGIVAGRYQYLTNRWNYFKDLIRMFRWNE